MLPAVPASVTFARAYVRMAIARHGLAGFFDVDAAELVISELVANALQHAYHDKPSLDQSVHLGVFHGEPGLLVTAGDMSDEPPVAREPERDAEGGRGLQVIAALSAIWGWEPRPGGGKVVYALIEGMSTTQ
jgi:anti-sigma regulatory factor (Ser/Thr protein kinase)